MALLLTAGGPYDFGASVVSVPRRMCFPCGTGDDFTIVATPLFSSGFRGLVMVVFRVAEV